MWKCHRKSPQFERNRTCAGHVCISNKRPPLLHSETSLYWFYFEPVIVMKYANICILQSLMKHYEGEDGCFCCRLVGFHFLYLLKPKMKKKIFTHSSLPPLPTWLWLVIIVSCLQPGIDQLDRRFILTVSSSSLLTFPSLFLLLPSLSIPDLAPRCLISTLNGRSSSLYSNYWINVGRGVVQRLSSLFITKMEEKGNDKRWQRERLLKAER